MAVLVMAVLVMEGAGSTSARAALIPD